MESNDAPHAGGTGDADALRRRLVLRYGTGLLILGVLSILSFAAVNVLIVSQQSDAPTINVSGRQRMLSQRVSLLSQRYAIERDATERARIGKLLDDAIALMDTSHHALTDGSASMGIASDRSAQVDELYAGGPRLDRRVEQYLQWANALRGLPESELRPDHPLLTNMLRESERPLLRDLNQAVTYYEAESTARVTSLRWTQLGLLLVTVVVLLIEAAIIFQPMVTSIVRQVEALRKSGSRLRAKEQSLRLVLDNTADGLFSIDTEGVIQPGVSARVEEWFGHTGVGEPVWMLLFPNDDVQQGMLEISLGELVDDFLPRELLLAQMPSAFERDGRHYALKFDVIEEDLEITGFVVSLSDVTAEHMAEQARADALEAQEVLLRALTHRDAYDSFVSETRRLLRQSSTATSREHLLRLLHTLKGNTASFGFLRFSRRVHEVEDALINSPDAAPERFLGELSESWNMEFAKVDQLTSQYDLSGIVLADKDVEAHLLAIREGVGRAQLVAEVRSWSHEPVSARLEELGRVAERIAHRLGKTVEVVHEADRLRLPTDTYGPLWSSLVHLVRNAVDHGIEAREAREAVGKAGPARIRMAARGAGPHLRIEIEDDGPGIDWARLEAKAAERGIASDGSHQARVALLFADQVSSRDEATELSGRGVGMGAVRDAVQQLAGSIDVTTTQGQGTRFTIVVPMVPVATQGRQFESEPKGVTPAGS
ncbi:MAG: ATP-binding protein [Myxococcota bacterium]